MCRHDYRFVTRAERESAMLILFFLCSSFFCGTYARTVFQAYTSQAIYGSAFAADNAPHNGTQVADDADGL
jgi:hypothetical protein